MKTLKNKISLSATTLVALIVVTSLVSCLTSYALTGANSPVKINSQDGGGIKISSCVIKWNRVEVAGVTKSVPYIFTDSVHVCPGVSSVEADSKGDLVLYASESFLPVMYGTASSDETLAQLGVIAGTSIGDTRSVVRFSRNGSIIKADDPIFSSSATTNLWFYTVGKN